MPRIDEYNETTSLSSDDYAILDGRNSGTRKIKPNNLVKNAQSFKDLEEFVGYINSTIIQRINEDLLDINEDITDVKSDIDEIKQGGSGATIDETTGELVIGGSSDLTEIEEQLASI